MTDLASDSMRAKVYDRPHRCGVTLAVGVGHAPKLFQENDRPPMPWKGHAKIAFIGSHSVRKSNAVHAFASAIGRAGRSVEVGREVVRFNPLGINEGATAEAQLWVLMAQVQQELELRNRAEVLVTDRSVVDNFAYYLRVTDGADPFAVEALIRRWAQTYDLFVRLLPDVGLLPDGVRSVNDAFRDEIEAILDRTLPSYLAAERLISIPASQVTESFDWWSIAERLAQLRGEVLRAEGARTGDNRQ
jgi:nicotinamide riboside kinase